MHVHGAASGSFGRAVEDIGPAVEQHWPAVAQVERSRRDPFVERSPGDPGAEVVEHRRQKTTVHPTGCAPVLGQGFEFRRPGDAVGGDLGVKPEKYPADSLGRSLIGLGHSATVTGRWASDTPCL